MGSVHCCEMVRYTRVSLLAAELTSDLYDIHSVPYLLQLISVVYHLNERDFKDTSIKYFLRILIMVNDLSIFEGVRILTPSSLTEANIAEDGFQEIRGLFIHVEHRMRSLLLLRSSYDCLAD